MRYGQPVAYACLGFLTEISYLEKVPATSDLLKFVLGRQAINLVFFLEVDDTTSMLRHPTLTDHGEGRILDLLQNISPRLKNVRPSFN